MQQRIAEVIRQFDPNEVLSDWYEMTLRQILDVVNYLPSGRFWGCWTEDELDTVFYDELA